MSKPSTCFDDTRVLYITIKAILPLFFNQKKVIPHWQAAMTGLHCFSCASSLKKGTGSGAYVAKNLQGCCTRMHGLYALGQVPVSLTPPPHPEACSVRADALLVTPSRRGQDFNLCCAAREVSAIRVQQGLRASRPDSLRWKSQKCRRSRRRPEEERASISQWQ